MALDIGSILGGSLGSAVKDIVGAFKIDPTKKAEFQASVDENAAILAQKQLELNGKIQDAITNEIQSAAEIIKAEAGSQSWLPRNVRPLLLLLWGCLITFNQVVPIIARFWIHDIQPIPVDPWVYKLTAIGFTGYVTARTWEKVKDADQ
jgi:hypothetical protein